MHVDCPDCRHVPSAAEGPFLLVAEPDIGHDPHSQLHRRLEKETRLGAIRSPRYSRCIGSGAGGNDSVLPAEPDQVHQERSGTCAQLFDRLEPKSLRDSDL